MVNKPLIRRYFWGAVRGLARGRLTIHHSHNHKKNIHPTHIHPAVKIFVFSLCFLIFPHFSPCFPPFFQISSSPRHLKNKVHKFLCFWNASLLNICCIPRLWDLVLRFGWLKFVTPGIKGILATPPPQSYPPQEIAGPNKALLRETNG